MAHPEQSGRLSKHMHSDQKSATEGALSRASVGAQLVPTGPITAAQSTFPRFQIVQPAAFSTSLFISTDRVDADPTDKG